MQTVDKPLEPLSDPHSPYYTATYLQATVWYTLKFILFNCLLVYMSGYTILMQSMRAPGHITWKDLVQLQHTPRYKLKHIQFLGQFANLYYYFQLEGKYLVEMTAGHVLLSSCTTTTKDSLCFMRDDTTMPHHMSVSCSTVCHLLNQFNI